MGLETTTVWWATIPTDVQVAEPQIVVAAAAASCLPFLGAALFIDLRSKGRSMQICGDTSATLEQLV